MISLYLFIGPSVTLPDEVMMTSTNGENGPISTCHVSLLNPYPSFGLDGKVKLVADLLT